MCIFEMLIFCILWLGLALGLGIEVQYEVYAFRVEVFDGRFGQGANDGPTLQCIKGCNVHFCSLRYGFVSSDHDQMWV